MTSSQQPSTAAEASDSAAPYNSGSEPTIPISTRAGLWKIMISVIFANAAPSLVWGSVMAVMLPLQVQQIAGDAGKVAGFAAVYSVGALASAIAQPVSGMLSDRTRSRFGRRAPWFVLGALLGGFALIELALANSLVGIAIGLIFVQIGYNFSQTTIAAVMPDRIPKRVRGVFAAFLGLGLMAGNQVGQIVGASYSENISVGYYVIGAVVLVLLLAFAFLNPEPSAKHLPKPPKFDLRAFARTFWVNPVKHPDFFWGFSGRLLLYLGYFVVFGYQVYILQDYIGLGKDAVGLIPVIGGVGLIGTLIGTLISGPVSDRIGRRKPFVLAAGLILTFSIAVPLIWPTVPGMLVFAFFANVGFGAYQGVDTALMSEVLPDGQSVGADVGLFQTAAALPQVIGPAISGTTVLVFGGYQALFPVAMVIAIIGAFAVLPIRGTR